MGYKPGLSKLAQKLNLLIDGSKSPDGSKWTDEKIAQNITAMGFPTTRSSICHMRNGRRSNPSAKLLNHLAILFKVPITYFLDDDEEPIGKVDQEQNRAILARAHGVIEDHLQILESIMREIEGIEKSQNYEKHADS